MSHTLVCRNTLEDERSLAAYKIVILINASWSVIVNNCFKMKYSTQTWGSGLHMPLRMTPAGARCASRCSLQLLNSLLSIGIGVLGTPACFLVLIKHI